MSRYKRAKKVFEVGTTVKSSSNQYLIKDIIEGENAYEDKLVVETTISNADLQNKAFTYYIGDHTNKLNRYDVRIYDHINRRMIGPLECRKLTLNDLARMHNGEEEFNYSILRAIDLEDKNGKMIFQGDIIKYKNETYEVTYEPFEARFRFENSCYELNIDLYNKVEIVGNIYDKKK